jgi:PAS domain S-box-containing protein
MPSQIKSIEKDLSKTIKFLSTNNFLPINIFLLGIDGEIIWVNDRLLREVKVEKLEYILHKNVDIFGKVASEGIKRVVNSKAEEIVEEEYEGNYYITCRHPIFGKNKKVRYVTGISINVTKIKQAEFAKTEFLENMRHDIRTPLTGIIACAQLLQLEKNNPTNMPAHVYWLDNNGIALGCNQNVLDIFGLKSIADFTGLTFEEMGRICKWGEKTTQSFKKDTLEVAQTGQAKLNIEEPPIADHNGRMVYFLTSRVPIFDTDGNVVSVTGISMDITKLKETQRALILEKREIADQTKTGFFRNFQRDIKISPTARWDKTKERFYLGEAFGENYFTRREAQVLKYILDGLQPKQIAFQLNLSRKRVDFVITQLKRKLGCRTQLQVIKLAVTQGWHCLLEENYQAI